MKDTLTIHEAYIGWTRGSGFVSKMIRRLEGSYFNHVFFRFTLSNGMKLIYESHINGGVQITPYEHAEDAIKAGKVLDIHEVRLDLGKKDCELLWNDCLPFHGDHYNARQILIYYAWIRLLGKKKNAKIFKLDKEGKYTCNQFVCSAGRDIVPELADTDDSFTPERLFLRFHDRIPSRVLFAEPR